MHLDGGQAELYDIDPSGRMEQQIEIGMHDERTEVEARKGELCRSGENQSGEHTPGTGKQENQWNGSKELRLEDETTESKSSRPNAAFSEGEESGGEAQQDKRRNLATNEKMKKRREGESRDENDCSTGPQIRQTTPDCIDTAEI